ncbi:MAG: hypothetical protein ABIY55_35770 [Kofleriaceae bacterium]
MIPLRARSVVLVALVVALAAPACTAEPGAASAGDDLTDPELPARGTADLPAWLAAGYYRAWHCEPEAHDARAPSPHGRNRICNNAALHAAGPGAFPAGAASVKEISDGGTMSFAVSRKLSDATGGDAWYWYESNPSDPDHVYANGPGIPGCTGCHGGAARDYVFTVVP